MKSYEEPDLKGTAREFFSGSHQGFSIYNGNIDPDNIYHGFDVEKLPPPLSGGLQEGLTTYYRGEGLLPKLCNDPYRILWGFRRTTSFGYLVNQDGLTTFAADSPSGRMRESLMRTWLKDFLLEDASWAYSDRG